ncbi:tyrosine-type recombinase/integrase [Pokkaliibacter plantistimulans]|nr:site-specific integrase [Pokkaliibacter plantistimulans]
MTTQSSPSSFTPPAHQSPHAEMDTDFTVDSPSMGELPPVLPLFDTVQLLEDGNPHINQHLTRLSLTSQQDATLVYEYAVDWLLEQRHSENNYKAYRSELTTFLHWCFDVEQIAVSDITRRILGRYLDYCENPPVALIAYRNVAQFIAIKETGERVPNPLWRPFLGKKQDGRELPYRISEKALRTKLAILSAFFIYLINEEYSERNPAAILLKLGRFRDAAQNSVAGEDNEDLKAFTELQWSYIMGTAEKMALEDPEFHERTLFLVSLMYSCYLRISEVAARPGFSPSMGQFRRDQKTGVWGFYIPRSKGGKRRTVAVSDSLLNALRRYRAWLGLSALPMVGDDTPLFVRHRVAQRGRDSGMLNANLGIRQLREVINELFVRTASAMEEDGFTHDGAEVRQMTPHSLRHTGISHDINLNQRPLSHVQADAGHDSIDTTSQYLHTSRVERHQSARNKPMDRLR